MVQEPNTHRLRYDLKHIHGSPVSVFTITFYDIRILSASHRTWLDLPGKKDKRYGAQHVQYKRIEGRIEETLKVPYWTNEPEVNMPVETSYILDIQL